MEQSIPNLLEGRKCFVKVKCIRCREEIPIAIPDEKKLNQFLDVRKGIGRVSDLTWMTPGERELFISGYCN